MRTCRVLLLSVLLMMSLCPPVLLAQTGEPQSPLEKAIDPLLGTPYRYGGTTTSGFDCSGFTSYIFSQIGVDLNRVSRDQALQGDKVAKSDLREGDLVFFNTYGSSISHVGIYLGDGRFVHSATNKGVTINHLNESYYERTYVTARRVIGEAVYKQWALAPQPEPEHSSVTEIVVLDVEDSNEERPQDPDDTLISRLASMLDE